MQSAFVKGHYLREIQLSEAENSYNRLFSRRLSVEQAFICWRVLTVGNRWGKLIGKDKEFG